MLSEPRPRITLLAPDGLCRTDGWRGTTNVVHVIAHSPTATIDVAALFPAKMTEWGLSLQSPFGPPRNQAADDFVVTLQARPAAVRPYSLIPPRDDEAGQKGVASAPLREITAGVFAASFYIRPDEQRLDPVDLQVQLSIGGLIVGAIAASLETAPLGATRARSQAVDAFKQIFVSYARVDIGIVEHLDSIVSSTGLGRLWWDVKFLKAGERWSERILDEIRVSDSFQLLWSTAARRSSNVRKELKFAIENREAGFVKPVYWEVPMPPPPRPLRGIHFARISVYPPIERAPVTERS